jgi:hypothetical protein
VITKSGFDAKTTAMFFTINPAPQIKMFLISFNTLPLHLLMQELCQKFEMRNTQ